MLVLTRKVGEQIVIDDNITVTIVAIEGNKIRLGITAPRSCQRAARAAPDYGPPAYLRR